VGAILALPQDAALPNRRVLDELVHLGRLGGLPAPEARQRSEAALAKVGLSDLASRKINTLSHGQRRRVGIAQALVGRDEVIILDEPTAGLDPRTALELGALVKELHKERTILLSSHNLAEVESLCTHAAILHRGTLVTAGTMDEIRGTAQRLQVSLVRPAADPAALSAALAQLAGVGRVEAAPDGTAFSIECTSPEEADRVTGDVLRVLLERGALVKGVERGQRLEQRFMQETAR
jgi:ABC-type multidrug transport system ATPase subunit